MLNIILALVVLMVMITIHELGHYTAGKLLGFKINEFAIGMGPKLYSKTNNNGEVFSVRLLPLGGFCAFDGEDTDQDSPQAFNNHKPWKRIIVLFSGVLFNFLTALIIGVIAFSCFGGTSAKVADIYGYTSSTNQNMLMEGDIICSIDGNEVYIASNLSSYFEEGDTCDMVVLRNGEYIELNGLTRDSYTLSYVDAITGSYTGVDNNGDVYLLASGDMIYAIDGVYLNSTGQVADILSNAGSGTVSLLITTSDGLQANIDNVSASDLLDNLTVAESSYTGLGIAITYTTVNYTFAEALCRVIPYCAEIAWLVLTTLAGLFTGAVGLDAVGGPITTISVTSEIVSYGLASILSLVVMLSVNLAVFNLLPIPALDGCRIVFVLIEWVRGKPLNRKVEGYIHAVGLILLVAFMVVLELVRYL